MNKFIKLIFSLFFLCVFFVLLLVILFGNKSYTDYQYDNPNEFRNSSSFSWCVNIFPKSSRNIFLRTFVETNESIIIFISNKIDELSYSHLYSIKSLDKAESILKNLNIPSDKKQDFLDKGELYCYFYQKDSTYLVSKYYSNDDLVHYMFIDLQPRKVLEICR